MNNHVNDVLQTRGNEDVPNQEPIFVELEGRSCQEALIQPVAPLIRCIEAQDLRDLVEKRGVIRASGNRTFGHLFHPDVELSKEIGFFNYGGGAWTVGMIVVFPGEIGKYPVRMEEPFAVANVPERRVEVSLRVADGFSGIPYEEYLVIRPEDWSIISKSASISEALARLQKLGISRDLIETDIMTRLTELIENQKKISAVIVDAGNSFWDQRDLVVSIFSEYLYSGDEREAEAAFDAITRIRTLEPWKSKPERFYEFANSSTRIRNLFRLGYLESKELASRIVVL